MVLQKWSKNERLLLEVCQSCNIRVDTNNSQVFHMAENQNLRGDLNLSLSQ